MARSGYWSLFLILLIVEMAQGSVGSSTDHLIPANDFLADSHYRAVVNKRLLVTPGDLARCVWLPGNVGSEGAVSLYKRKGKGRGADRVEYRMTVTQAAKPIWESIGKEEAGGRSQIEVRRFDALVPEAMALAIAKLWRAMLTRMTTPPAGNSVSLDAGTELFSATVAGHEVVGRLDKNAANKDSLELLDIANSLLEYFNYPPSQRPDRAKQIRDQALALKDRIERKKE